MHRALSLPVALWIAACSSTPAVDPAVVAAHREAIEAWQAERDAHLRDPTGWLTLAGLHWLKEGDNRVGSDPASDVPLPQSAPAQVGTIALHGDHAVLTLADGVAATAGDQPITAPLPLASDASGTPTRVRLGPLRFYLIARSGKLAVRVKDEHSPYLKAFRGVQRYPIDIAWRFTARFVPRDAPAKVTVPNVLGTPTEETSPGWFGVHQGRRRAPPGDPRRARRRRAVHRLR